MAILTTTQEAIRDAIHAFAQDRIRPFVAQFETEAEFERDLLIERTQSGLARAKAQGKNWAGRRP